MGIVQRRQDLVPVLLLRCLPGSDALDVSLDGREMTLRARACHVSLDYSDGLCTTHGSHSRE